MLSNTSSSRRDCAIASFSSLAMLAPAAPRPSAPPAASPPPKSASAPRRRKRACSTTASCPAEERPAPGQGRDRRGEQDQHQALHLRRRPRPLVGPGYDCSGAVSYALQGGDSSKARCPPARWKAGARRRGRWITVYANAGHAYTVIAGIRWDTSGDTGGETGPRWHQGRARRVGFVARHPAGTRAGEDAGGRVLRLGQPAGLGGGGGGGGERRRGEGTRVRRPLCPCFPEQLG